MRDSDKNSDRNSRYRDIWTETEGEGQWDSVKDLFQTLKKINTPITKNLDY